MDTCICMAEFLCFSPDTITTLLIGYITIQNKKCFKSELWNIAINNLTRAVHTCEE